MKNTILILATAFFFLSFTSNQQLYTVKKGYAVAFSKASFDKMINATSTGDRAYFDQLIDDVEIMVLPGDISAYLDESHSLKGYRVMRVKGKDIRIWAINEAIKRNH